MNITIFQAILDASKCPIIALEFTEWDIADFIWACDPDSRFYKMLHNMTVI